MSAKIIGIKVTAAANKPGVKYYNYFYEESFSDYDLAHAEVIKGKSTGVQFSSTDINVNVGDEVEFLYTKGYQDKAVLVGARVIKPAPEQIGKK